MSTARELFIDRMLTVKSTVDDFYIIDRSPTNVLHNNKAQLLRNGLCIICFTMIEDYIKKRVGEFLDVISSSPIAFSALPDGLRKQCTAGVVDSLQYQKKLPEVQRVGVINYLQEHAKCLASTAESTYKLSSVSFAHSKANLAVNDIGLIFFAFNVKDAWNIAQTLLSIIGFGIPSLRNEFENFMKLRHSSAHNTSTTVTSADLISYPDKAISFCIAFDFIITRAVLFITDNDVGYLAGIKSICLSDIKIRYIDERPNGWAELASGSSRATAIDNGFATVLTNCKTRAKSNNEFIVQRDKRRVPINWFTQLND